MDTPSDKTALLEDLEESLDPNTSFDATRHRTIKSHRMGKFIQGLLAGGWVVDIEEIIDK